MKNKLIAQNMITILILLGLFLSACAPTTTPTTAPPATEVSVTQPPMATQALVSEPTTAPAPTAAPPTIKYSDSIVIAQQWDPDVLDPAVIYDESAKITQLIYENLVGYKGDSVTELIPELATDWKISDDGLVYTFNLRKGVKFQDGTPFNAAAVKFSFDRFIKLGKGFSYAWTSLLKEVKVVDDSTVQFILTRPYGKFIYMLATRYGSPIVAPSVMAHEQSGDLAEGWLKDHAIGTGPYMLTSWTRGEKILLDYYPDYWRGWTDKNIKHVTYLSQVDPATERQMLERGDVQIAGRINVEDLPIVEANPNIKVIQSKPGSSNFNWFILFNTQNGIFKDIKVREALSWAFPYKDCVDVSFAGVANQAVGPIPLGNPEHGGSDLFMYHQDLDKAKQLLTGVGLLNSNKTIRIAGGDNQQVRKLNDLLTTTLGELGFKVEFTPLQWTALFQAESNQATAPDIAIADWYDDYPDGIGFMLGVADWFWWGSGRAEKDYFYFNPDVKKILEDGDKITDPVKRKEAAVQAQKLIIANIPAIWAIDYLPYMPMQKNVQGYVFNPYYNFGWDLYNMYIEQ